MKSKQSCVGYITAIQGLGTIITVSLFVSLIYTKRYFHFSDKYQEDLTVESVVLVLSVRAPKPDGFTTTHDTSVTMDAAHAVMNMFTTVVQSLLHQFNIHANVRDP